MTLFDIVLPCAPRAIASPPAFSEPTLPGAVTGATIQLGGVGGGSVSSFDGRVQQGCFPAFTGLCLAKLGENQHWKPFLGGENRAIAAAPQLKTVLNH